MALIRLDRFISSALGLSRSDAKRLLSSGRVAVDGSICPQGSQKVDADSQRVTVDGKEAVYREHSYIVMDKPLGVISSTDSGEGKTVIDILPPELCRRGLFPAGRLDKYTSGMLIITDDGDFAHRLLAPSKHLPKVYRFELDAPILTEELRESFKKGVYLGGGEYSSPALLEIFSPTSGQVTIFEGIYHQVRRMFDQNGGRVTALRRVKIGGLPLPADLCSGGSRFLTGQELSQLFSVSTQDEKGGPA